MQNPLAFRGAGGSTVGLPNKTSMKSQLREDGVDVPTSQDESSRALATLTP